MKHDKPIAIIGTGPYGLSLAAHLRAQGIPTQIFGKPMEFWRNMPPEFYLKSVWTASSLSDPAGKYSITRFYEAANISRQEPIPLSLFLEYGAWFQRQAVHDVETTYVESLAQDGHGFHLDLANGRSFKASKVIVATGIARFAYIPDFAQSLPHSLASHTQSHTNFSHFRGRSIVIVGSGQSALECAAMAYEAGAQVEVITRDPIRWINRALYQKAGPLKHVFYSPSDVGPPGINWLTAFPVVLSHFPNTVRQQIDTRAVRPAGAQWLRSRVEGSIKLTPYTHITSATEQGECVRIELSDGTTRTVDHLLLGTGYQPDVQKLPFIHANLQPHIQTSDGRPVLNQWFESSQPDLYFVGALAGYTFGPICRFVAGAKVAAQQITRHVTHVA